MLTREQFLKDTDLKREPVEIAGLGQVLMRELSIGERMDTEKNHGEGSEVLTMLALVAVSLCEPDGSPMFADDEIASATVALQGKSLSTMEALQKAFLRLNGISEEDIKEAVGNSTEIPSGGGSSASPVISDTPVLEPSAAT